MLLEENNQERLHANFIKAKMMNARPALLDKKNRRSISVNDAMLMLKYKQSIEGIMLNSKSVEKTKRDQSPNAVRNQIQSSNVINVKQKKAVLNP